MKYTILTSSNKKYECLKYNKKLIPNIIIVDWKENNKNRLYYYYNKLKTFTKRTFIIIMDASDVICLNSNISDMFTEFLKFNKDIIFGAEDGGRIVFHNEEYNTLLQFRKVFNFNKPNFKMKYNRRWLNNQTSLNAGLICGYSDTLVKFFNKVIDENKHENKDDQICFIRTIINNNEEYKNIIGLDFESKLFHNFRVFHEMYNITHNKIIYNKQLIRPYFVHFPGINFMKQNELFNKLIHEHNINL